MELRDTSEFSDKESQKELEKIYGKTVQDWEEVEFWDDVLSKEEKALNSQLEEEFIGQEQCPHLAKLDNYFFYCHKRAKLLEKQGGKLTGTGILDSAQYDSQVNHFSLQLWCMQPEERYCKCTNFMSKSV